MSGKRILTIFFFSIVMLQLCAQPTHRGTLFLKAQPEFRFYLYVDGMQQNKRPVNSITISEIPNGRHQLTIILAKNFHPQSFYQVNMDGRDQFFAIDITGNPHEQYVINFRPTHPFKEPTEFIKALHGNQAMLMPQPQEEHHLQPGQPVPIPPAIAQHPHISPCDAHHFMHIKKAIEEQSFSEEKMSYAKQAISSNNLTSIQILEIARLFSFDKDRIELLKFAHQYCFDAENYHVVFDALNFSSSKKELEGYLLGK